MNHPIDDPYRTCEYGQCNHDLARAVTIDDLHASDGPFPARSTIVQLGGSRDRSPSLFDELELALEERRAV